MNRIEFEIIDHGCDGEQYFPGCGVAFTKWTDCVTGIGDSAREAAEDAADQMAMCMDADTFRALDDKALDVEIRRTMSEHVTVNRDDPEISDEWHHYVSIRWRIVSE